MPKIIWMLWCQGWDRAPEVARACATTWVHHNPGWQIRFLSAKGLAKYAPETAAFARGRDVAPVVVSDIARLELLARHGGVWADATTYCIRPLDDWISKAISTGFFAFDLVYDDKMLSNWFLAACPGSHIAREIAGHAGVYWQKRRHPDNGLWFHQLFKRLYNRDDGFRDLWDAKLKLSARLPHHYIPQDEKLFKPLQPVDRDLIEKGLTFMVKLNHNLNADAMRTADRNTVYRWLIDRTLDWPARGQLDASIARLAGNAA